MRFKGLVLLFCVVVSANVQAQKAGIWSPNATDLIRLNNLNDALEMLGDTALHGRSEMMRTVASQRMIDSMSLVLAAPNSFNYFFECLSTVSVVYPPDSTFRVFTWQVYIDQEHYQQYGILQRNTAEPNFFVLTDKSDVFDVLPRTEQLDAQNWLGALYYNVYPFKVGQQTAYLLFGLDSYSYWSRRKMIEVLTFAPDGSPVFGLPVFDITGNKWSRFWIEYSAYSSARLNFDTEENKIIFDYLQSVPRPDGQGDMMTPDGTYEAFELRKGTWKYIEKLPITPMETAPNYRNAKPETRDIIGKKKIGTTK